MSKTSQNLLKQVHVVSHLRYRGPTLGYTGGQTLRYYESKIHILKKNKDDYVLFAVPGVDALSIISMGCTLRVTPQTSC
jgi:hypothetical protein